MIAARPSLGKSTVALDLCRTASIKHGLTSVIFSLEMSRNEIVMRLLSAEAQVPLQHMRSGTMSEADWSKLAGKMGAVSDAPLFIDDSPNMNLMEIRAKCRRLKQRHDLRLVVVDYLQLMSSGKRVESRQQEVSEFSRSLKLLAKELDVPVIAISQLNRGPEQRQDKRPMLADLRESVSLEQDADLVLLLHREDFYERESPRAAKQTLSWPSTAMAQPQQSPSPSRATTHALLIWRSRNPRLTRPSKGSTSRSQAQRSSPGAPGRTASSTARRPGKGAPR